jgi:hypothetical protein
MDSQLLLDFKLRAGVDDNPDQEGLDLYAQLLIEQCITLLKDEWYTQNNQPAVDGESLRDIGFRVGRKTELIAMMHKINHHFGVEE